AATRDFLRLLNDEHLRRNPGDSELSARIAAYELAGRMQTSAPEAGDLSRESPATQKLYALDDPNPLTSAFGRNCLLARRLLERWVRFITLFNGAFAMGEGVLNWDGHRRIESDYNRHGPILDKPAAALLIDLKARGLLDDTLVVWTTEFGRMPTFQNRKMQKFACKAGGLRRRAATSSSFHPWRNGPRSPGPPLRRGNPGIPAVPSSPAACAPPAPGPCGWPSIARDRPAARAAPR